MSQGVLGMAYGMARIPLMVPVSYLLESQSMQQGEMSEVGNIPK
jgi:hypothetical protein